MALLISALRRANATDIMALAIIIATGALGYALIPMVQP
jgi:hypothetical protein